MNDGDLADLVRSHLLAGAEVRRAAADHCATAVVAGAQLLATAFQGGHKVLLCGNGGSAADCQHVAAEFVSRLTRDFDRPAMAAIALTTDTSIVTAYANDVDFDGIFARQVEALGRPGDVLIGISTSGNSRNVIRAVEMARTRGMGVLALVGAGGALGGLADVALAVPHTDTQFIQETHLALEHTLCMLAERLVHGVPRAAGQPA